MDKKTIINKLKKACVKLEVHNYSPEQNKLYFRNSNTFVCGWSIDQNYNYTIDNSIDLMVNKLNIDQLKQYFI